MKNALDRSAGRTRRDFFTQAAATTLAVATAPTASAAASRPAPASSFLEIVRAPSEVTAYAGLEHSQGLERVGLTWHGKGIVVATEPSATELPVQISAPGLDVTHLHLRWHVTSSPRLACLGDAWERSYGDLGWRGMTPERVMPWYFATHDGQAVHGYGVKTAAGALCFWQLDPEGVSLWLDLRNGGSGVRLGDRQLRAAIVVSRRGRGDEHPVAAVRQLCRAMCSAPRLTGPVYGSNDWYYAYGHNSAVQTLRDADLIASLTPAAGPRPFAVIDAGWTDHSPTFPDMGELAAAVRQKGVRPGIWVRPLEAPRSATASMLLPGKRFGERSGRESELAYDPTVPEALTAVLDKIRQVRAWGYQLVKHDFSTYDLLGQWGFEMGAQPSLPGWSFHDRSRTNAEIILDLYRALRATAGEAAVIIGCNTVGHLSAGLFDLQRIGDDTSGRRWERTRRMGVNTLAYRLPQHDSFFAVDPDCIGITKDIPWELNRQWLELVARCGAALFVSPGAVGPEQLQAITAAFALAAAGTARGEPVDWFHDTTPERWRFSDLGEAAYSWCSPEGAYPFTV
ncbi:MAG: alpha-amylase family protein [Terriglobales bacterium]